MCIFLTSLLFSWSKYRDLNPGPPVPKTGALPTELHLDVKWGKDIPGEFNQPRVFFAPSQPELHWITSIQL